MATRLILLCCAATALVRTGGFPGRDDPLDEGGATKARGRAVGSRPAIVVSGPAQAAAGTADGMEFEPSVDDRLSDMRFGDWEGRSFEDVLATDPARFAAWIARPEAGTPGGETLAQVRDRIRPWLAEVAERDAPCLAITHASVIRAILAEALGLPDPAAMRFDIPPLGQARLSFNRVWRLQELSGA